MSKSVLCPHCGHFFLSHNEPGNPFCMCPACGRWMDIAPKRQGKRKPHRATQCPFCGTQLALGGDTCLSCHRQIITGEMLPLRDRLALVPMGKKMAVLCGGLAFLVSIIVIVNVIVTWVRHPTPPRSRPVSKVTVPEELAAKKILDQLLHSTDDRERTRLSEALGRIGPAAVPLALKALERSDLPEETRRGILNALGEIGDPRAADALAEAMKEERFHRTALISLAMVGDRRAAEGLVRLFTEAVRHASLGNALMKRSLIPAASDPTFVQRQWAESATRLHRPAGALGATILPDLLAVYWSAWDWPIRDRGQDWLDQVDRVLGRMSIEGGKDTELEKLLAGGPSEVRLAAAMLLRRRQGAGHPEAEKWAETLKDLLTDSRLEIRQKTVWVVACLTDRKFGGFVPSQLPCDVTAASLKEIAEWMQRRTGQVIHIAPSLLAEHPAHDPVLRRQYHPARAMARNIVPDLPRADWSQARACRQKLFPLPADAAPVVRELLQRDPRDLRVPARLVVLQVAAHWRERSLTDAIRRLDGLLDNPPWMSSCVACAVACTSRNVQSQKWLDAIVDLDPAILGESDPAKGFVPSDLGLLIAPLGRPAFAALHRDDRFRRSEGRLFKVYSSAIEAMTDYGWPVAAWLSEAGR